LYLVTISLTAVLSVKNTHAEIEKSMSPVLNAALSFILKYCEFADAKLAAFPSTPAACPTPPVPFSDRLLPPALSILVPLASSNFQ